MGETLFREALDASFLVAATMNPTIECLSEQRFGHVIVSLLLPQTTQLAGGDPPKLPNLHPKPLVEADWPR